MVGALQISLDLKKATAFTKTLGKNLQAEGRVSLRKIGAEWEQRMKRRFLGFAAQGPTQGLRNRSGALRNSLRFRLEGSGNEIRLKLSSEGIIYSALQEFGGTVSAKAARALTIPLPAALTPTGNISARGQFTRGGTGPRGGAIWTNARGERSFIFRSRAGNLLIGIRSGARGRGRLIPMYVLKDSVEIPGRLGFFKTWDKMREFRNAELSAMLRRAIDKSVGGAA